MLQNYSSNAIWHVHCSSNFLDQRASYWTTATSNNSINKSKLGQQNNQAHRSSLWSVDHPHLQQQFQYASRLKFYFVTKSLLFYKKIFWVKEYFVHDKFKAFHKHSSTSPTQTQSSIEVLNCVWNSKILLLQKHTNIRTRTSDKRKLGKK